MHFWWNSVILKNFLKEILMPGYRGNLTFWPLPILRWFWDFSVFFGIIPKEHLRKKSIFDPVRLLAEVFMVLSMRPKHGFVQNLRIFFPQSLDVFYERPLCIFLKILPKEFSSKSKKTLKISRIYSRVMQKFKNSHLCKFCVTQ